MPKLIELNGELVHEQLTAIAAEKTLTIGPETPLEISLLENINRVDIKFENFTDGRGYSTAKLVRERFGWKGNLRAIGDITVDQLGYLARCGFDSFSLRDDQDIKLAKHYLNTFSAGYQRGYVRHG
jgi:uncharacterized protein (DUF934 family)